MRKIAHYVLLEHELTFYDYCFGNAIKLDNQAVIKNLKRIFKSFISSHHKSQEMSTQATVWAIRQILKRKFYYPAFLQFKEELRKNAPSRPSA